MYFAQIIGKTAWQSRNAKYLNLFVNQTFSHFEHFKITFQPLNEFQQQ